MIFGSVFLSRIFVCFFTFPLTVRFCELQFLLSLISSSSSFILSQIKAIMMEWEKPEQQNPYHHHHHNPPLCDDHLHHLTGTTAAGALYVKVMTDDQLETLRKQIAVYATICEQLVEMHKTLTAHQDLTGAFSKLIKMLFHSFLQLLLSIQSPN